MTKNFNSNMKQGQQYSWVVLKLKEINIMHKNTHLKWNI